MLVVHEVHHGEVRVTIDEFAETHVAQLGPPWTHSDALHTAIAPIVAKRAEVAAHERHLAALKEEQATIAQDQQRLRENMKALRGSAEEKQLLQRYTRQLDEQENTLEALRARSEQAVSQRNSARAELRALIAALTFGE
jgi:chromosome segregation ATPase